MQDSWRVCQDDEEAQQLQGQPPSIYTHVLPISACLSAALEKSWIEAP